MTSDRYNVYLIGNGTGAYEIFKTLYVNSTNPKQLWDSQKSRYLEYAEKAFNGDITEPFKHDSFKNEAWYAATQDNFEYWLQWPELMVANKEDINNELKKSNMVKKLPNDMYASLSEENKAKFMSTVGIDKNEWDTKYFPGLKDGKKYMIISGTSADSEGGSFERVVKDIINDYGNEYTYYYKPHPRYPANKVPGREEFLKNNNIIELPAQTPLETIIWAYPEITVGGYSSSTYMSAVSGQVDFFIANSPSALGPPLPEIYNLGFYNNSKFYRINSKNLNDNIKLSNTSVNFNNDNTKNIVINFSEVKEPASVFLVLYDENGKLISSESITIDENNLIASFKNIPTDSLKTNAKVLVWDGNDTLNPQLTTIYGSEF